MKKTITALSLFLIFGLQDGWAEISSNCLKTAQIFILKGQADDPDPLSKQWNFSLLDKTISGNVDPNNCLEQIFSQAVSDSRSYWEKVHRDNDCANPKAKKFNSPPCRFSSNFTDAETNLTYLDSIQAHYDHYRPVLNDFVICQQDFSVMEDNFLDELKRIGASMAVTIEGHNAPRAPEDHFENGSCQGKLNCLEKITYSQIVSQLATAEAAGELTEAKAQEIINAHINNLGPIGASNVMKAVAEHALKQNAPIDDLKTLSYIQKANASILPEMLAFEKAAQELQDINDEMQRGANEGWFWDRAWSQVSSSYTMLTAECRKASGHADSANVIELCDKAFRYKEQADIMMAKLDTFLVANELSGDKKKAVHDFFQGGIKEVSLLLKAEVEQTHQSIDQTRKVVMAGAGAVMVVGLGVAAVAASPLLLPGITAAGGTGMVTSLIAAGGVVGTGAALAIEGAAITAVTNLIGRAVTHVTQSVSEGDFSLSGLYCRSLELEMQRGGMKLVTETAQSAGMSVVLGGGIGAMITKGGRWAKAGGLIAVGGLTYGAGSIVKDGVDKIAGLENIRPYLTDPKDVACLNKAQIVAGIDSGFDAFAMAAELLGPVGIELYRGRKGPREIPDPSVDSSSKLTDSDEAQDTRTKDIPATRTDNSPPEKQGKLNTAKMIPTAWDSMSGKDFMAAILKGELPIDASSLDNSRLLAAYDYMPASIISAYQKKMAFYQSILNDPTLSQNTNLMKYVESQLDFEKKHFLVVMKGAGEKLTSATPLIQKDGAILDFQQLITPDPAAFAKNIAYGLSQIPPMVPYRTLIGTEARDMLPSPLTLSGDELAKFIRLSGEVPQIDIPYLEIQTALTAELETLPMAHEGFRPISAQQLLEMKAKYKAQLEAMGIEPKEDSEIPSYFQHKTGLEGYSSNYRITPDDLPPPKGKRSTDPALTHPEMAAAIRELESKGYHLVIDTSIPAQTNAAGNDLGVGAYQYAPTPDQRSIALLPKSDWLTFQHEYQHLIYQLDYLDFLQKQGLSPDSWDSYKGLSYDDAIKKMEREAPKLILDNKKLMKDIWELRQRGLKSTGIDETLATRREQEILASEGFLPVLSTDKWESRISAKKYGVQHRIKELETRQAQLKDEGKELSELELKTLAEDRLELARIENYILPTLKWANRPVPTGPLIIAGSLFATASWGGVAVAACYYHEELQKFIITYTDGRTLEINPSELDQP